jgi:ubiquinone/menaquinone biosynthesis C-methylase UbiE
MHASPASSQLKEKVRDFWNAEPCGTRYLDTPDDFAAHARARYELEPFIPKFAQFASTRGQRVLEIGVGMGADYLEFLKAGARAIGVDLSAASIEQARRRCQSAGFDPDLKVSDAEDLTLPDDMFDIVYSYGVLHHSADVPRCLREVWRVLRPGGQALIMLYAHPSLTGFMLWLRFGLFRGQSIRQTVYERLESPGTKTFTVAEVRAMMERFEDVTVQQVFSPGDLLLNKPSPRFTGGFYRMIWLLFPRFLMRAFCRRFGLFLLISAGKPANPAN